MDQLKSGGVSLMLDVLNRQTVLAKDDRPVMEGALKTGRALLFSRVGKSHGEYELIGKDVVGESLVRFIFLENLERAVLIWPLRFYRVKGEWYFSGLDVEDNPVSHYRPVAR